MIIDSMNNNTNNQNNKGSNVNKKCPRNLCLMNNVEPYDIIKDIANLKCNISLSQLVNDLTPSSLGPHHIKIKEGFAPIKLRYYRTNNVKSAIIKDHIKDMINKRIIIPSSSEWSFPVVLVPKNNSNDWRFCVDYRKLNDITVPDSYSLPYIDEIFDNLGGAEIFSTLDLFSGYHQILLDDDSVDKTCFTTKYGNFVFKVMPFGLCNAPATFHREMNKILFDLIGVCVYIFIDDILIFSKTPEEHVKHLILVLDIFKNFNIKINIEKCQFMRE